MKIMILCTNAFYITIHNEFLTLIYLCYYTYCSSIIDLIRFLLFISINNNITNNKKQFSEQCLVNINKDKQINN